MGLVVGSREEAAKPTTSGAVGSDSETTATLPSEA